MATRAGAQAGKEPILKKQFHFFWISAEHNGGAKFKCFMELEYTHGIASELE